MLKKIVLNQKLKKMIFFKQNLKLLKKKMIKQSKKQSKKQLKKKLKKQMIKKLKKNKIYKELHRYGLKNFLTREINWSFTNLKTM